MLNQETKRTSLSLTPCTKHHPNTITQQAAARAWCQPPSGEAASSCPARQASSGVFSAFTLHSSLCLSCLSVLISSSFRSLLLPGSPPCRNSDSSDRAPSGFSRRTEVAVTSWPRRASSSWLSPWPYLGSLESSRPRCCPTGR